MISDVIWHHFIRIEEKLAEAKTAYDEVDEPTLIAAVQKLAGECLQLARRESRAIGLRVAAKPDPET